MVRRNGVNARTTQAEENNLYPTFQVFIALIDRKPEWLTEDHKNAIIKALADFMDPAWTNISVDHFTDDNDESVAGGGVVKPVLNIQVKGNDVDALERLKRRLEDIRDRKISSSTLWDSSLDLGRIHFEGGKWFPRGCYVPKSVKKSLRNKPSSMQFNKCFS